METSSASGDTASFTTTRLKISSTFSFPAPILSSTNFSIFLLTSNSSQSPSILFLMAIALTRPSLFKCLAKDHKTSLESAEPLLHAFPPHHSLFLTILQGRLAFGIPPRHRAAVVVFFHQETLRPPRTMISGIGTDGAMTCFVFRKWISQESRRKSEGLQVLGKWYWFQYMKNRFRIFQSEQDTS